MATIPTATTPLAPRSAAGNKSGSGKRGKYAFWAVMGLVGISVLYYTDLPLLHTPSPYRSKLIKDMFLLVPHAVAGVVATALGPFQFSTQFRQKHLAWHRLMGKSYVIAVCVAAPMAVVLGIRGVSLPMQFMAWVQGILWLGCTLLAFITARNRQITVHRQWMVRSYAFTLNFIFSRALNPIPAYFNMPESAFALTLAFLSLMYFVIPDVAFSWRELTHKRA
jgi:uncharacterized membrane protein